ncbi:transcriptional regulator [Lentzea pudingi]|uniref:Transcriptional regulator n=1 Tax=Lentzea pudingi TaxID=1789439 RepID=A0ABQ2HTE6_9PSEU|nr:transcriptional regulator [Lentzea pudingi]
MRGREFGDAMRALLRAADLTNRAAAELLGWQEAKVSELVNGKEGVSDVDLAKLLGLLRTPPDEFDHLMALHHETHQRDWLQPKAGTKDRARTLREQEQKATGVTGWSMNVVHGLVQAPDYIAAMVNSSRQLSAEERPGAIRNRIERQNAALDGFRAITLYIHEQALRLPVGSPDVMADQLHHLLRVSVRPYLTIRVIPTAAGPHDGLSGSFDMLTFKKIPPLVYVESAGATVFLEDQPSVGLYEDVLKSLGRTALDEARTRMLITDIIGEEFRHDLLAEK